MAQNEDTKDKNKPHLRNVTETVVDYFIERILDGSWKVGEKIPSENTLTKLLGVSRSSVRSAIQQFIGVGAMESMERKGTYLRDSDLSKNRLRFRHESHYNVVDALTLLEYRVVIEPECCFRAVSSELDISNNIENLHRFFNKMKESIGSPEDFVHYDLLFHEEIILMAGNVLLLDSFRAVMHNKTNSLQNLNESFGYKDGIYYHTLILSAIEKRDASLAKRLMHSHLQKAIDDIHYENII